MPFSQSHFATDETKRPVRRLATLETMNMTMMTTELYVTDVNDVRVDAKRLRTEFYAHAKANRYPADLWHFVQWCGEFGYEELDGDFCKMWYAVRVAN